MDKSDLRQYFDYESIALYRALDIRKESAINLLDIFIVTVLDKSCKYLRPIEMGKFQI